MSLKIFDGEDEIEMTRQEVTELTNERAAEIYFTNEIYKSEVKKLMDADENKFTLLFDEISESSNFLLKSLIDRVGEEKALDFAAHTSLMIILEDENNNESN